MFMNVSENVIWNALEKQISFSLVTLKGTWISLVNMIDVDCGSGISFSEFYFLNVIDFGLEIYLHLHLHHYHHHRGSYCLPWHEWMQLHPKRIKERYNILK